MHLHHLPWPKEALEELGIGISTTQEMPARVRQIVAPLRKQRIFGSPTKRTPVLMLFRRLQFFRFVENGPVPEQKSTANREWRSHIQANFGAFL